MKKFLVALLVTVMMLTLCSCSDYIGQWRIHKVVAGDVTMEEKDIEDMGLDPGYVKLTKSGKAELNLLGDEYEGTWTTAEDGTALVTYGDNMTGVATKTEEGMHFKDAQGSEYDMERF